MTGQPVEYQSRRTETSAPRQAACHSARNIGALCVVLSLVLGLIALLLFREMGNRDLLHFAIFSAVMLATATHFGAGVLYLIGSVKVLSSNPFWERVTAAAVMVNLTSSVMLIVAIFLTAEVMAVTCAVGIFGPVGWWQFKVMRRMRSLKWIA